MSCMAIACLVVDLSIGQVHGHDGLATTKRNWWGVQEIQSSRDSIGRLSVSIESKWGVYVEYGHESSIDDSDDRGFERSSIGIRRQIDLLK